jgi:hypothetical protein
LRKPIGSAGSPSVKDAVEALGVPHVEVNLTLVNGQSVDFAYRLQHGDYVSVYPSSETLGIYWEGTHYQRMRDFISNLRGGNIKQQ